MKLEVVRKQVRRLEVQLADLRAQKPMFETDAHTLRVRDLERRLNNKKARLYRMEREGDWR